LGLLSAPLASAQRADDRLADDQYNFATQLYGKKLYELALQQYERFVVDYPKHPNVTRARIRIGESNLRLNRNEQAAAAFGSLLAENPATNFRLEALVGLGLARFNLKDFPKAIEALTEAQRLAVEAKDKTLAPLASNWLGESYFQSKKYNEAMAAYGSVLGWPGRSLRRQALYSIGFCLKETGQDAAAAATWQKVVEQFPTSEIADESEFRAGEAMLRLKNYPAATQVFTDLLQRYKTSQYAPKAQ